MKRWIRSENVGYYALAVASLIWAVLILPPLPDGGFGIALRPLWDWARAPLSGGDEVRRSPGLSQDSVSFQRVAFRPAILPTISRCPMFWPVAAVGW